MPDSFFFTKLLTTWLSYADSPPLENFGIISCQLYKFYKIINNLAQVPHEHILTKAYEGTRKKKQPQI